MANEEFPKPGFMSLGPEQDLVTTAAAATLGYGAHITRAAYLNAEPFRPTRQGIWISEDLSEPMKSETGRSPINWNI
jgi:hypothetical protein